MNKHQWNKRTNPNEKNGDGCWFLTHSVTKHVSILQKNHIAASFPSSKNYRIPAPISMIIVN